MLAIIRKGDGEYYTSLVFGYYSDISSDDDEYQRYLNSIYNRFYIVLDESKTKLIKQVVYDRNNKYLSLIFLRKKKYGIRIKSPAPKKRMPAKSNLSAVADTPMLKTPYPSFMHGIALPQSIVQTTAKKYSLHFTLYDPLFISNPQYQ